MVFRVTISSIAAKVGRSFTAFKMTLIELGMIPVELGMIGIVRWTTPYNSPIFEALLDDMLDLFSTNSSRAVDKQPLLFEGALDQG